MIAMIDSCNPPANRAARKSRTTRQTDGSKHFTPQQLADRWGWHVENVRRAIRQRRLASIVVFRRRLVPVAEIERIEAEGRVACSA